MKGMTIHMEGQVQGVGIRPYVYRLARRHRLKGWICSEPDGIRIQVEGDDNQMGEFVETLRSQLPPHARVSRWITRTVRPKGFAGFEIVGSRPEGSVTADITPDVPLCDDCRNEIRNPRNHRHGYPFTSCTHCGPRYSIQTQIPFDRIHTSMAIHVPCPRCVHEAQTQTSRRYFSQTHSCPDCAIPLTLLDGNGNVLATDWESIRSTIINQLKEGLILAIKGTGGYELVADAANATALQTLRLRKGRPSEPLGVMYPDMYTVKGDAEITPVESAELFGLHQPIVVVRKKNRPASKICSDLIAPHLDTLGVMLPYTALFELLLHAWGKPLVVTSANVSGAPVEYRDAEALVNLKGMADGFLTYQLNLVVPQDESVVRFAPESGQPIMLRRGRGHAPSIQVKAFSDQTVLAMGADTQGAFALQTHGHIFVSQFLGNLQASRSRKVYRHTLNHLVGLTRSQPAQLLIDRYARHAARAGETFTDHGEIPVTHIPHGHAHAFSVMAENQLLSTESVLCFVWDDGHMHEANCVQGGEAYLYVGSTLEEVSRILPAPVWMRDAMTVDLKLAALFFGHEVPSVREFVLDSYSKPLRDFHTRLLESAPDAHTTSIARLFDAVSYLVTGRDRNSFEGESVTVLERLAACGKTRDRFPLLWRDQELDIRDLLLHVMKDLQEGKSKEMIAYKFHCWLADGIMSLSHRIGGEHVAFSGRVFQNALLVDLIHSVLPEHTCCFQKELPPNDECVALGQLAAWHATQPHRFSK